MSILSGNIKYLRAKKQLSQSDLAEELRLTRNQINSYENDNSQPSIEVLKKLSIFFQLSIDVLICVSLNKKVLEKFALNELNLGINKWNEADDFQENHIGMLNIFEMFCNLQQEMERIKIVV